MDAPHDKLVMTLAAAVCWVDKQPHTERVRKRGASEAHRRTGSDQAESALLAGPSLLPPHKQTQDSQKTAACRSNFRYGFLL